MDKQVKPSGIIIMNVINSLPIIMAAVGCIIVIIRFSGYPGVNDAELGRMVGSIASQAILPGIILRSIFKRRYSPAMICTVLLLMLSCSYPLFALVALPNFIILRSNADVKKYLNKEEREKNNKQKWSN